MGLETMKFINWLRKKFELKFTRHTNIAKAVICLGGSIGCNSWSKGRPANFGIEIEFLIWTFSVELNWSYKK